MSWASAIAGNPASILSMAKILQYLTLFLFIPLKDYPNSLK